MEEDIPPTKSDLAEAKVLSATFKYKIQNRLDSRGYAELYKISETALDSIKNYGEPPLKCPFEIYQLRMISLDYAYSAWENFLEHIGFILFSDWDSKNKQRHYDQKVEKLLKFSEIVVEKSLFPLNLIYENLEKEWLLVIEKARDLSRYKNKRNPLKHIHSGNHDVKLKVHYKNHITIDKEEHEQLIDGTNFNLTDSDCNEIFNEIKELIESIHTFLKDHKLIFLIYPIPIDQKAKQRFELFRTFLVSPLAQTLYVTATELQLNHAKVAQEVLPTC